MDNADANGEPDDLLENHFFAAFRTLAMLTL